MRQQMQQMDQMAKQAVGQLNQQIAENIRFGAVLTALGRLVLTNTSIQSFR